MIMIIYNLYIMLNYYLLINNLVVYILLISVYMLFLIREYYCVDCISVCILCVCVKL